ncbi:MAG: ABC transporter ATP-binding protein [Candidatus Bathyarchaeia archaeon]
MVQITLDHITKVFERKIVAVDDLCLEIKDGEFLSLLGPSGCGKTTTMRMIAGLETPTKGKIYFDDQDVTNIPPEKRNVGMVFQTPVVYPISVYKNLAFPLRVKRCPEGEIRKRVKEIADLLGLTPYLDVDATKLDKTMRQKVSIGRVLIRPCTVYIFDEAFTMLEQMERLKLRKIVKEMQKERRSTMIYVTHDQIEALALGDEVAIMWKGKLIDKGTPREVYEKPQTTMSAWFLGSPGMNLLQVSLKKCAGKAYLEMDGFTYEIDQEICEKAESASSPKLVLGIRPEYVKISLIKKEGWIGATVNVVQFIGNEQIIWLKVGKNMISARTSIELSCQPGDSVYIHFPREKIRIYDSETQKLLYP